jgi:hypothetical protein
MNISQWLHDMQWNYTLLCNTNCNAINDRAFALAILDNMVQDETWRSFLSAPYSKVSG